jgi:secreted trypsin-like serine protease
MLAGVGRFCLWRRGIVLAALLLAAGPLPAIIELDSSFGVTDADYQNLAASYPSVGKFSGGFPDSGVLIAGNWVLTAAHVGVGITVGTSTFIIGGNAYTVAAVDINPGYNGTTLQDDIALVRLSTNVANVTPAVLYNGTSELGTVATWVGYGVSGNGTTGDSGIGRGTVRAATNAVDAFYQPSTGIASQLGGTALLADFDDNTTANNTLGNLPYPPTWSVATPTSLEGSLAPGDSGGGVFANISSSIVLIGLNDFVAAGNFGSTTQYGAILGATRVSPYVGWIDSSIPEPGQATAAGGVLAVLAALGARKRRGGTHRGDAQLNEAISGTA